MSTYADVETIKWLRAQVPCGLQEAVDAVREYPHSRELALAYLRKTVPSVAGWAAAKARIAQLEAALRMARKVAGEAFEEWDRDNDPRVGKLLRAMSDPTLNYRADISEIHAVLNGGNPMSDAVRKSEIDPDDFREWIRCDDCGGQGLREDCFEDTCVCLNPPCCWSRCDFCEGKGGWYADE